MKSEISARTAIAQPDEKTPSQTAYLGTTISSIRTQRILRHISHISSRLSRAPAIVQS
jgi:hypothetical protein